MDCKRLIPGKKCSNEKEKRQGKEERERKEKGKKESRRKKENKTFVNGEDRKS